MPRRAAKALLEQLLRKPDPRGYYVIPIRLGPGQDRDRVAQVLLEAGVEAVLEEAGDTVYVLVRARSVAKRALEVLVKKGYRVEPG
jgi:transcriptional/translational regulatory protein YebC/TACO1